PCLRRAPSPRRRPWPPQPPCGARSRSRPPRVVPLQAPAHLARPPRTESSAARGSLGAAASARRGSTPRQRPRPALGELFEEQPDFTGGRFGRVGAVHHV